MAFRILVSELKYFAEFVLFLATFHKLYPSAIKFIHNFKLNIY